MKKFGIAAAAAAIAITALTAPASASNSVPAGNVIVDESTLSGPYYDGMTPSVIDGYIEFDANQYYWYTYNDDIHTVTVELPYGMSWSTDASYNDVSVWGDCSWSGTERVSGRELKLSGVSCYTGDGDQYYDFSVSIDDAQILSTVSTVGLYGIGLDYRRCDNRGTKGCKYPAWDTDFSSVIDVYSPE